MRRNCFPLFVLLVLGWIPQGHSSELAKVIQRVEADYKGIQTIEAKFDQTYTSTRFDPKKAGGRVSIAKPGKMRWDYDAPKGKVLVSNGKKITLFDPIDKQAMESEQSEKTKLPLVLSFLWGEMQLGEVFNCNLGTSKEDSKAKRIKLHCLPKEPIPNVLEVYLFVQDKKPALIERTKIVDAMGGANDIRFSSIQINRKISSKRFEFEPPPGTETVSLGEGGINIQ